MISGRAASNLARRKCMSPQPTLACFYLAKLTLCMIFGAKSSGLDPLFGARALRVALYSCLQVLRGFAIMNSKYLQRSFMPSSKAFCSMLPRPWATLLIMISYTNLCSQKTLPKQPASPDETVEAYRAGLFYARLQNIWSTEPGDNTWFHGSTPCGHVHLPSFSMLPSRGSCNPCSKPSLLSVLVLRLCDGAT